MNTIAYIQTPYSRFSKSEIKYQKSLINKYCKTKKYFLMSTFKEVADGDIFYRPEWRKLIEYIKSGKGQIQKIVFTQWERLSNDAYVTHQAIKELQKLNVEVECILQPLDMSIHDNLLSLHIWFRDNVEVE